MTFAVILALVADSVAADPPFVTLKRTACYGTCPDYSVKVLASGRVEYHGTAFVKLRGNHSGQIGPAQLAALERAFARADFCHRQPKYNYFVFDAPWVEVKYGPRAGHPAKCPNTSVEHVVDEEAPQAIRALMKLEEEIDRLVQIEDFIGSQSYRSKCFHSMHDSERICAQDGTPISKDQMVAEAMKSSEEFIARNGYTNAAPDRNALDYEAFDSVNPNVDTLLARRRGTLEPKAFGYFEESVGSADKRIVVCFRYKKDSSGSGRGVSLTGGRMRMEHQDVRLQACQPRSDGGSK